MGFRSLELPYVPLPEVKVSDPDAFREAFLDEVLGPVPDKKTIGKAKLPTRKSLSAVKKSHPKVSKSLKARKKLLAKKLKAKRS